MTMVIIDCHALKFNHNKKPRNRVANHFASFRHIRDARVCARACVYIYIYI